MKYRNIGGFAAQIVRSIRTRLGITGSIREDGIYLFICVVKNANLLFGQGQLMLKDRTAPLLIAQNLGIIINTMKMRKKDFEKLLPPGPSTRSQN